MTIHDSIRIRLSAGLIAVAIIHALALAVLCIGFRFPKPAINPAPWNVPCAQQLDGGDCYHSAAGAAARPLQQPPPSVNLSAQGELKQQQCNCNPFGLRPGETLVHVGPARPNNFPTLAPPDPLTTPFPPSVVTVMDAQPARPAAKQYQILLFLDGSSQAVQLKAWFAGNRELVALRQRSDMQVYTPENPLYRQRYASLVSPDQFPAIILQDASGGHIHAAGKAMIPTTASQLVADLRKSYELYKQAKQGQMQATGAIRETGYRWDDGIHPAMRLYGDGECGPDGCGPDGCGPNGCPPAAVKPRPVLDHLFGPNTDENPLQAFLRVGPTDIATIAVFSLAAVLVLALVFRKRG